MIAALSSRRCGSNRAPAGSPPARREGAGRPPRSGARSRRPVQQQHGAEDQAMPATSDGVWLRLAGPRAAGAGGRAGRRRPCCRSRHRTGRPRRTGRGPAPNHRGWLWRTSNTPRPTSASTTTRGGRPARGGPASRCPRPRWCGRRPHRAPPTSAVACHAHIPGTISSASPIPTSTSGGGRPREVRLHGGPPPGCPCRARSGRARRRPPRRYSRSPTPPPSSMPAAPRSRREPT